MVTTRKKAKQYHRPGAAGSAIDHIPPDGKDELAVTVPSFSRLAGPARKGQVRLVSMLARLAATAEPTSSAMTVSAAPRRSQLHQPGSFAA